MKVGGRTQYGTNPNVGLCMTELGRLNEDYTSLLK